MARRDRSTSVRPVDARVPTPGGTPVIAVGNGERTAEIGQRAIVVGRGGGCDLVVAGRGLSRRHAKLRRGLDNRVTIFDLDSTNGTFVDGVRVEACAVTEGSHIQLGSEVTLRLWYRPDVAAATISDELTAREHEIALLVGEGLANQEIADKLGITRRTVTTHVSRIFEKLGIGSRLELIRKLAAR